MKSLILRFGLLATLALIHHAVSAAPGDLDPSFDAGSGVAGLVRGLAGQVGAMVVQPDGKILIAGAFTTVKGLVRRSFARLNADGSGDPSFNPSTGSDDGVYSVALQPDGKVLIGGYFTTVNGISRTNVARLNADGTLDTSFDLGSGMNSTVYFGAVVTFLALQSDGKVLIGGTFTSVSGVSRRFIARLNSNGSLDTSFNPGAADTPLIALQPDGKVLLYDGSIVRLNADGSRDTSFNPGTGPNGGVYTMASQQDGKVLIGGYFTRVNGIRRGGFARLNTNGSLDMSFSLGDPNLDYPIVSVTALQSDGKVLIGGGLGVDTQNTKFARLNADGTLDSSFDPTLLALGVPYPLRVSLIALQADGKVLICGDFTTVNGVSRYGIARLSPDGGLDTSFNAGSGLDNRVHAFGAVLAIASQPDGKVLIGGRFDSVGGLIRPRIARLNPTGSLDASFDSPLIPYPLSSSDPANLSDRVVHPIVLQPDGKILVGSTSRNYLPNGEQAPEFKTSDVARLNVDGSLDSSFNPVHGDDWYGGLDGPICVALQSDGKVIIGGAFKSLNDVGIIGLARLNADGSLDFSFNPGLNGPVFSVVIQPDGKVLIGGDFTAVNGISCTNIARLNADGTLDSSFDPSTGANYPVSNVALQPDGKVLIGGSFTTVNGVSRRRIARLNVDGSLDTSFNPGTGTADGFGNDFVDNVALQPDGKLIIGGNFTTVNGVSRNCIARLNADGSLDTSFNQGNAVDGWWVRTLALQPDGRLLIGGGFGSVDGFARNHVARLFWGDPAILVSGPVKDNDDFVARFKGTPGLTYTIESSANVSSAAWQKVSNRTAPTNDLGFGIGVFELRNAIAPSGQRFYRAVFPAY